MERRILKDFQIGLVEGIVQDVLVKSHEPKDVFSQIAKAIGTRSSSKAKNWNEIVRKNTVIRNPIGSTQASIHRKNRRSLRRHIMDAAHQGMDMNTDKLLEYNPKLSEVSQSTRVAYVKFMSKKFGKDDHLDAVFLENEEKDRKRREAEESSAGPVVGIDSVVKKASIIRKESQEKMEVPPPSAEPPASLPPPTEEEDNVEPVEKKPAANEVKDFRLQSPIPEDPNEDRTLSPEIKNGESSKRSSIAEEKSPLTPEPALQRDPSPRPTTPVVTPPENPSPTDIPEDNKLLSPKEPRSRSVTPSGKTSPRPVTPIIVTPSKGKSAVSGRHMEGWI